jgi:hypothetical protein
MQICTLEVRVEDLAARLGFAVINWDDDGLGPATSIFVRFESGRVALLTEHAHAVEHHCAKGPIVNVAARDLAEIGVASFVDEVLDAFKLSRKDADWIAPAENKARALDMLRWWEEQRAKQDRSADGDPRK